MELILESEFQFFGIVSCITGDNLGGHWIARFSTNFSSANYFCRYCLVTKSEFIVNPKHVAELRTVSNYNADIHRLHSTSEENVHGIKFSSIFNKLKFFHVCKPGLPPCLGHDLFEGIV